MYDPKLTFTDWVTGVASYIIYKRNGLIYAKNANTGQIEFSGIDATTVIQDAINAS